MTLQELAGLPVGTKVRFLMELFPLSDGSEGFGAIYDFGTVVQSGVLVHILWDACEKDMSGVTIIDTKGAPWFAFIKELEVL